MALVIGAVSAALHDYGWTVRTGHDAGVAAGTAVATVTLGVRAVRIWEVTGRGVGLPVLLHASITVCSLLFAAHFDPL